MSDKISNDRLVSFNNFTKHEKNEKTEDAPSHHGGAQQIVDSIGNLGDGVYGRAQVQASQSSFAGSPDVIKDTEFFKNSPELVEFCDEVFDVCIEKGMSYEAAFDRAYTCTDIIAEIS